MSQFIKKAKKSRGHKVSSVNLETYQYETIKALNIDFSALVRFLVDKYFSVNYPDEYFKNKRKIK
jgi:hypothetical protein